MENGACGTERVVVIQMRQCRQHFVGRRQDFAYQQEVDGNQGVVIMLGFGDAQLAKLLPEMSVDWLAAGTYDKIIGTLYLLFRIHKIDENIDIERIIIESVKVTIKC